MRNKHTNIRHFALTAVFAAFALQGAWASDIPSVKKVDNRGGNSIITTDANNLSVKVVILDGNHNPLESWIRTIDAKGRLTIPSDRPLFRKDLMILPLDSQAVDGQVIAPEAIPSNQPFTFDLPSSVDGEVVSLQGADGSVVAQGVADSLGRIFLPAGAAAGLYAIVVGGHHHGTLSVQNSGATAPPLSSSCLPTTLNQSKNVVINGQGLNPNAAKDLVQIGAGPNSYAPVLAASGGQIVVDASRAPQGLQPISIANAETGASAGPQQSLVYELTGHLVQTQLTRPARLETHFMISFMPTDADTFVDVSAQGPVNFGDGKKTTTVQIKNGCADVPILADPSGVGPYHLSYGLEPLKAPATTQPESADVQGLLSEGAMPTLAAASAANGALQSGPLTNALTNGLKSGAQKLFLDWWKDYLEAMCAYEMLDGWITSPFHYPLSEDEVRAQARTQVTALTPGAKVKLAKRLRDRAKVLRDKAKGLRQAGDNTRADMAENQANAMDWAAGEVTK